MRLPLRALLLGIALLGGGPALESLPAQSPSGSDGDPARPSFDPLGETEAGPNAAPRARRRGASIFGRRKAERPPLEKHTLIQVLVRERATARGDSREDTQARASADLEIASYLKFKDGNLTSGTNPLALDVEADKRRQVRDQNQRSVDIQARITARVVDVLPNGNVRIEARSERRINDELTVMTLTGEVRSADIDEALTVSSDRIADQKLVYSAANPRTKRSQRTVVERVLLFLWPF